MAENIPKRNYPFTDADLCMLTSNLCNSLSRNESDFAIFGINSTKISELKALGDAFEVFPTDFVLVGDIMAATENKNSLRQQVLETIRNMALRVEIKWSANSPKYKRLELNNPSQQTDNQLLVTARAIHSKVSEYLADLAVYGLTQNLLDDFENLNGQYEQALNFQADAVTMRDEKKLQRIAKGNEIYRLVSAYCNFGKRIYEKNNSAKYHEFLIFKDYGRKKKKTEKNEIEGGTMEEG